MNLQMITTIVQGVCLVLTGLLALDNAVDAIAKAFGNKKVDTICGVIALKINEWLSKLNPAATTPPAPPTVPPAVPPAAKAAMVAIMLLIGGSAFAQVDVGNLFSKLPNLKQGAAYDVKSGNATFISTAELLNYAGFSLSAGYSTSSAIVGSLDYDIGGLSKLGINVPILSMVDLRIGMMVGMSDISTATTGGSAERNKLCWGPELTIVSVKF